MRSPTSSTSAAGRKAPIVGRAPRNPNERAELLRCGTDPLYFINEYCKIQHPTKGTLDFKTYPFQDRCIKAFLKHRFNIILKSRQLGLSTIAAGYAVWLALFRRDKNILVMAQKSRTAKTFIKKVRKMLTCLPQWLLLSSYEESQQEVRFDNGSQIVSIPTTDDAGRAEALSLLIVDEAAIIRNFEEIWGAIYPTLAEGGSAIILSTPNGVGGQYYDLWMGAETDGLGVDAIGKNGFHPIKLPWDVHPEHDQTWFEAQQIKLGHRKTGQEMLCDFLSSGQTFLQTSTLEWLSREQRLPLKRDNPEAATWVWEDPIPRHKYILGADVARGDARDFSTFVIVDMASGNIVVEYQGKVFPDKLAELIDVYGRRYNNALAVVEGNTFGNHTLLELKKFQYTNIFYPKAPTNQVENYFPGQKERPGFDTQTASRLEALAFMEDSLRGQHVVSRSSRMYDELQSFVYIDVDNNAPFVKQKAQAKRGHNDDLVMALAFACWVYRTHFERYRLSFKDRGHGLIAEKPLIAYASRSSKVFVAPGNFTRTLDHKYPLDPRELDWLLK